MALLAVEAALRGVLEGARALADERVPVEMAGGRVLAEDVRALRTQPPADMSAMDGYAVRGVDVAVAPVRLRVTGEVAAGRPFAGSVGAGEAARIFTGGVLPAGADTIVIQEVTARDGDALIVQSPAKPSAHVRRRGIDFSEGEVLLPRGRRLTARDTALAAALNHASLRVYRQPRVVIFSTGDELRPPGSELGPGQIISSNGIALATLVRSEGADAVDLGIVRDRVEDTVAAVRRARELCADILVTCGGASVGDYDLVQPALAAEGLSLAFWKVAVRPGKPLLSGRLGGIRVLGMPGNPVSAFVCGILFLLPLIRTLGGRTDVSLMPEMAVLGCDLPANDERADYLRARLSMGEKGEQIAEPFPSQDSSLLVPLAKADCLLIRPPFAPAAARGTPCSVIKLPL